MMLTILPVLASALIAIVLGGLWYGPFFGTLWMKETAVTPEIQAEFRANPAKMRSMMVKNYGLTMLSSFVMAFVLAHAVAFTARVTGMTGVSLGVLLALFCWFGFIVPVSLNPVLWDNKSWRYFAITTGYYLVSLVLMSTLLAVWR